MNEFFEGQPLRPHLLLFDLLLRQRRPDGFRKLSEDDKCDQPGILGDSQKALRLLLVVARYGVRDEPKLGGPEDHESRCQAGVEEIVLPLLYYPIIIPCTEHGRYQRRVIRLPVATRQRRLETSKDLAIMDEDVPSGLIVCARGSQLGVLR